MPTSLTLYKNGKKMDRLLLKELVTIGKSSEMDLTLNQSNISRQHCRVYRLKGQWILEDLGSRNGTWVDGVRIESPQTLFEGSRIKLGDYELIFSQKTEETPKKKKSQATDSKPKIRIIKKSSHETSPVIEDECEGPTPLSRSLKKQVHEKLLEDKSLKALVNESDDILFQKTKEVIENIVANISLPHGIKKDHFIKVILDEALGLGPLEDLIADDSISEIMVNNWSTIYVERHGRIQLIQRQFTDNQQLVGIIRRILAPIGRRIDESSPMVDARLKDGSRVNAIIPPLALNGPTLTIRKFTKIPFSVDDLIQKKTLTSQVADFLKLAVTSRQNILIAGGTGSGKTTLLNLVSGFIPESERIVTIEDAAELRLKQEHVVRLEARPANIEGEGAIPIRQLVINALRMRPDRIVVGECRAGEALDMLQAMNTGHDGSLTTLHANSPRDALARLETLVLMAGMDLPALSIRQQIASAINLIIQTQRTADGVRRLTHISEITGMEGDVISMAPIYQLNQSHSRSESNSSLQSTSVIPRFIQKLRESGMAVDNSLFQKGN